MRVLAAVYIPAPILSLCCAAASENPDVKDKKWAQDIASKLISQLQGASDQAIRLDWSKYKNKDARTRIPRYMHEDTTRKYRQGKLGAPELEEEADIVDVTDDWRAVAVTTPDTGMEVPAANNYGGYYQESELAEPDTIDVYGDDVEDGKYGVGVKREWKWRPSYSDEEVDHDVKNRIRSLTIKNLTNVLIGRPGSPYPGQILLEFKTYSYPRSMRDRDYDYFYIKIVADASQLSEEYLESFYDNFRQEYDSWTGPTGGRNEGKRSALCPKEVFLKNAKEHKGWDVISFHDGRNNIDLGERKNCLEAREGHHISYRKPKDWSNG